MSVYKRWKHHERLAMKILGGERNTEKGTNVPDGFIPNKENPWASVENKSTEELPKWLRSAVVQAETNAKPNTLPLVSLMENNGMHLVVLRAEAFREWFGEFRK